MRRSSGGGEQPRQGWNDDEFAQLQGGHDDVLPRVGQIVRVGAADLLDEAMRVQAFEHTRELRTGVGRQDAPQGGVAEAVDLPLAARQGGEKGQVVGAAQVEATITAVVQAGRLRQLVDLLDACGRIGQIGEEGQIAAIGRAEHLTQGGQAINRLLHGGEFGLSGAVAMFHPPVVTKERDVVDGRFDAQNQGLLVIELEGDWSPMVLQARPFDARVKVMTAFILVVAGEFAAEKGGDIGGLDRVDGGADQGLVEGAQVLLPVEDEVGGILHLHQAPVIGGSKARRDRATARGQTIKGGMQLVDREGVGERLRLGAVAEGAERIVEWFDGDAGLPELSGQPVVAVAVELQPERHPGRDPEITQTELRINEVEIVVQTLAVLVAQRGLARHFIMPGREGGAGFHRREDVDQTGVVAPRVQERGCGLPCGRRGSSG